MAVLNKESKLDSLKETYSTLEDLIKAEADPSEIEDMLEVFLEEFKEAKRAHEQVLQKMLDAKKTKDEYKDEDAEFRGTFRGATSIISAARRMLSKSKAETLSSIPTHAPNMKLPKIELPKFKGEVREWIQYWSQFKEIDENPGLSDSDKYQYLIQSTLEGSEAREIIMSFPVCAENYPLAVQQLKKMYGSEKMLVKVYIRDLLKMVIDNAQNKSFTLLQLYYKLSAKLKALETLGVTQDKCASVIYPLVESCIPEEVLRTWQRHPNCKTAEQDGEELEKLIEFLEKEVEGDKNIRAAGTGLNEDDEQLGTSSQRGRKQNVKSYEKGIPTAAGLLSVSDDKPSARACIFCERENHESASCRKASSMPYEVKERIIKEKRACFACLKIGHQASKCRSRVNCLICQQKHQTIMCRSNSQQGLGNKVGSSAPPQPPQFGPEEDKGSLNVRSTMTNQIQTPEVLLQTLKVKVHGSNGVKNVRALIDTGSQKSYVLKQIAEEIGLKKLGTEKVIHGLFGGAETNVVEHSRYKVK